MTSIPTEGQLRDALVSAGQAHHDYQENFLDGVHDEQWPGWYAAYVLGRLGDFTTPTMLTRQLEAVTGEGDWSQNVAGQVRASLPLQG